MIPEESDGILFENGEKSLLSPCFKFPKSSDSDENINVLLSSEVPITTANIDLFNYLGGEIISGPWQHALYGFSGIISAENYSVLSSNFPGFYIEDEMELKTAMNLVNRDIGGYPYIDSTYPSMNRSSQTSIALLDTGILPNQSFFNYSLDFLDWSQNNSIIAWEDFVNGQSDLYDDNGHGTMMASAIMSNGTMDLLPNDFIRLKRWFNFSHLETYPEGFLSSEYEVRLCELHFDGAMEGNNWEANISIQTQVESGGLDEIEILYQTYDEKDDEYDTWDYEITQATPNVTVSQWLDSDKRISSFVLRYKTHLNTDINFSVFIETEWLPRRYEDQTENLRGISPYSNLIPLKIADSNGISNTTRLIDALDWISANWSKYHITTACIPLELLNVSDNLPITQIALSHLLDLGIFVVIPAGNDGLNIAGKASLNGLCLDDRIIVVGAMNDKDMVASYSAMGEVFASGYTKPDLIAPGGSLVSEVGVPFESVTPVNWLPQIPYPAIGGNEQRPYPIFTAGGQFNNSTSYGTGTSFSSAIVAGALDLLFGAIGGWITFENCENRSQLMLDLKSILLMTCTETIQLREEDPSTEVVYESQPGNSPEFNDGGVDVHEGYGRINPDAMIDLFENPIISVPNEISAHLRSSIFQNGTDGQHAIARRLYLEQYKTYMITAMGSTPLPQSMARLYLYKNCSKTGYPELVSPAIQASAGAPEIILLTPTDPGAEYIIVLKAIYGEADWNFQITELPNNEDPRLENLQVTSNSPVTNDTLDLFQFNITYIDGDNSPPTYFRLNVTHTSLPYSKNYTMVLADGLDITFFDGSTYTVEVNFPFEGKYNFYIECYDARGIASTYSYTWENPDYQIEILDPYLVDPPYETSFSGNLIRNTWKTNVNGWKFYDLNPISLKPYYFWQVSTLDAESEEWDYGENIHAELYSPNFNISSDLDNPRITIGFRLSVNDGDQFRIYLLANKTRVKEVLSITELSVTDWQILSFSVSEWKDYYVQILFIFDSDGNTDYQANRGVIIDFFKVSNESGEKTPQIQVENGGISSQIGSEFDTYKFSITYSDQDGDPPEFVKLNIGGQNFTMYVSNNSWNFQSGEEFYCLINGKDFIQSEYCFIVSDGQEEVWTSYYSISSFKDTSSGVFFPWREDFDGDYSKYRVNGFPFSQDVENQWCETIGNWHVIYSELEEISYWYCGVESDNPNNKAYGRNWNSSLVLPRILLNSTSDCYLHLQYQFRITKIGTYDSQTSDYGIIEISRDKGRKWVTLSIIDNTNQTKEAGWDELWINIEKYKYEEVLVRFRFVSDNYSFQMEPGAGWKIKTLEFKYIEDRTAPEFEFLNFYSNQVISGKYKFQIRILDESLLSNSTIKVYINGRPLGIVIDRNNINATWDPTFLFNGLYSLEIKATDIYGNQGSARMILNLENPLQPLYIGLIIGMIVGILVLLLFTRRKWNRKSKSPRKSRAQQSLELQYSRMVGIKTQTQSFNEQLASINPTDEEQLPFVLYCKKCKRRFTKDEYSIFCPFCGKDSVYLAKKCVFCNRWEYFDEPGEYYCSNKKCGRKLVKNPDILSSKSVKKY